MSDPNILHSLHFHYRSRSISRTVPIHIILIDLRFASRSSINLTINIFQNMSFKLLLNSARPAIDALAIAQLINSKKDGCINIQWCKEWNSNGSVQLLDKDDKSLGETSNEIARYFGRTIDSELYGGLDIVARTDVDHWLSYTVGPLGDSVLKQNVLEYLDKILLINTWLVAKRLTIADIHVFCALLDKNFLDSYEKKFINLERWYKQLLDLYFIKKVMVSIKENRTQLNSSLTNKKDNHQLSSSLKKQEGKFFELPGAEIGKVIVRFPPEASGYLHIGHAKAALLNQYYAVAFKGQLIMRFDDTNPAKEKENFEKAILEDLELLQIKPNYFTHSSDYFDIMLDYCTKLLKEGKAYVDDTPAEAMKEQRDQKLKSINWNNSVDKNVELWEEMKKGTTKGQKCCVRAKIDYESANGCLRDPTIYRCKLEPHPRTETKYKVYPTYDFACPIVDSIEGVTHTLRTTEYHDRDDQFYWFIDALDLRRPYIWEYSRLNMTNTVLSKRKLTWFVDEGLVDGWDDPRFPTVRGILRRGMTVEGLKQFIIAQGSSRSVVFMEWDKIWAFNKKVIDPIAVRYTALNSDELVPVEVMDAKEECLIAQKHPKDVTIGTKKVYTNHTVFIEKADAGLLIEGQNTTFINWGNLLIMKIDKNNSSIVKVKAKLNLEDKNYKNTAKITWLSSKPEHLVTACYAVYFKHIINKPVLGKDDNFKDYIEEDTRKEVKLIGEQELKSVKKGEIIQLQRKGFFRCDVAYEPISKFSFKERPIILFHIPDGHATSSNADVSKAIENKVAVKSKTVKNNKEVNSKKGQGIEKLLESFNDTLLKLNQSKRIINEEKVMKHLIAAYEAATGENWTVICNNTQNISNNNKIIEEIQKQGDKIRQLKSEKAEKDVIDKEVKTLLSLKNDYKSATGEEWKPGANKEIVTTNIKTLNKDDVETGKLSAEIQKQGDKVRQLKSEKAAKDVIDKEIKTLLSLKNDYKSATGEEWKPGANKEIVTTNIKTLNKDDVETGKLSVEIQKQGDKIRQLKSEKVAKDIIDKEVKTLLSLKNDYKSATGEEWKPTNSAKDIKTEKASERASNSGDKLSDSIKKQGDKIRYMKGEKAAKDLIDKEVKALLSLKTEYKMATGQEWKPSTDDSKQISDAKSNKKSVDAKSMLKAKKDFEKEVEAAKTGTRLGLEVKKHENFFEWYSQVITKSGMIEYYDVSGCYILRPWSFAIWRIIKKYIDDFITELGVQDCYFPIFVTRAVLEKEKAHIADFAPEVAWVTKCGDSDLAEPIAIRPTSETVMYPAYAKWLKSDSELPLRLNQWNNVVRWEFKDPKPFLRTREFLWQEGHTAFATKAEADEEVLVILDLYARVYEKLLAIPVVKGRKTEKEKFAGGDYTTTVEAFIDCSGRAIQGATSHHLGQNFSKMFNIQVEGASETDEKTFVYQNSWGLTTRTIGVMIMVHGDDKGLVLPPNIASIQGIIVPCGITANTTLEQRESLSKECNKLLEELNNDTNLRIKADFRSNRTPGWKFNNWELKGVPVRIELGPKDLEKNQVTFVRRDNSQRVAVGRTNVVEELHKLLADIQLSMLERARIKLNEHIVQLDKWDNFCSELNKKNLILSPFCGEPSCEDNIKTDSARQDAGEELGALSMGAKSLCIPFQQPKAATSLDKMKCIHPGCQKKPKFYTLFGRSY